MQSLGESAEVVSQVLKAGISSLMNLAGNQGGEPSSSSSTTSAVSQDVYFVNFNQDYTSLAVGNKNGFRLYSLESDDTAKVVYEKASEDACIVERLFSSSLLVLVNLSTPRKLTVCHFKKSNEICQYSYANTILAVKLNRLRVVVCQEESLFIHSIRDMRVIHTIRDTPANPLGVCALSAGNENCFLAYPGNNTIGEAQIFDADNLQAKTMIPAHDSPLAALAFNQSGTQLATASKKGTVIRVFSILEGVKLFEFRRGMKRCVSISTLAFNYNSNFLCVSSNTETVHIFKLEKPRESSKPIEDNQGWMGYVGKALMTSANYLPTQVTDMFNQGRAFATVHLPFSGLKNVCCITNAHKQNRVLVASSDGYLYVYNFDPIEGGDCTLLKQQRLDGRLDPPASPIDVASLGSSSSNSSNASGTHAASGYATTGISYSSAVRKLDKGGDYDEADSMREMALAVDSYRDRRDSGHLPLDDENEFPPMTRKAN
ncbi:hypothetical protein CHUAL_002969 [Chamberlinius hualienensis]